jgi:hypothetical protein
MSDVSPVRNMNGDLITGGDASGDVDPVRPLDGDLGFITKTPLGTTTLHGQNVGEMPTGGNADSNTMMLTDQPSPPRN